MTSSESPDAVLVMQQASRSHGDGGERVDALVDVDMGVAAGELVAITGRSGSGKSTLVNLAGGLDQPTGGRVLVDGIDLGGESPKALAEIRRRHVGYVFQNLNLLPTLTAAENVALPLEFDGIRPAPALAAAREALGRVGLNDLAGRYPDEMSGGQRQRVAIARAVVGPRRLILADEPTGALDELTGEAVLSLLVHLASEGAAVVLVTHDPGLAAYAHRVIRLRDGRIDQVTERSAVPPTPEELRV